MDELEGLGKIGETHAFSDINTVQVRRSSVDLGWKDTYISVQSSAPYSKNFDPASSVFISVVNDGSLRADIGVCGNVQHLQGPSGIIGILLADNVPFQFDLHSRVETTHLYIGRSLIEEVAVGIYDIDPGCVQILSKFCFFDPVIESICWEIQSLFDEGRAPSFSYVDYLVRAVAAHLLKNHSNIVRKCAQFSGGSLSAKLVERTRELIESRLAERLTIADLAAGTGISADHFGRQFKNAVGMSLHQFVIHRRIERASDMLRSTAKPIIQIAYECGFADQVHLTRTFGRIVGTTPAAFRRVRDC